MREKPRKSLQCGCFAVETVVEKTLALYGIGDRGREIDCPQLKKLR